MGRHDSTRLKAIEHIQRNDIIASDSGLKRKREFATHNSSFNDFLRITGSDVDPEPHNHHIVLVQIRHIDSNQVNLKKLSVDGLWPKCSSDTIDSITDRQSAAKAEGKPIEFGESESVPSIAKLSVIASFHNEEIRAV
jgi:hypothetical protein